MVKLAKATSIADQVRALEERNQYLENTNEALIKQLELQGEGLGLKFVPIFYLKRLCKLSVQHMKMLEYLMGTTNYTPKLFFYEYLNIESTMRPHSGKSVEVLKSQMKMKLYKCIPEMDGVDMYDTVHGQGFRLTDQARKILSSVVQRMSEEAE